MNGDKPLENQCAEQFLCEHHEKSPCVYFEPESINKKICKYASQNGLFCYSVIAQANAIYRWRKRNGLITEEEAR